MKELQPINQHVLLEIADENRKPPVALSSLKRPRKDSKQEKWWP